MSHYSLLVVFIICLFHGYNVHMQVTDCGAERRRDPDTNCTQCRDGLDLSTDCTTCLSPLPIQCEGRDPNCTIGHFTFSALFHSYTPNSQNNVRLIYCVQPHGSPPFSPQFPSQKKLNFNNFSIPQGFIVQGTQNSDVNWNRSNPYTVELRIWTGQIQFYIVTYNFGVPDGVAFDMFLINLTLNIGPTFTDRTTYYGIMGSNVTFDLSFRVQCSENYYGPHCNLSCSQVDLATEDCISDSSENGSVIGAAVGGSIAGIVLIVLIILLFIFLVWTVKRRKGKDHFCEASDHPSTKKTQPPKMEESHSFNNSIYGEEIGNKKNKGSSLRATERQYLNSIYGNEITDNVYTPTSHPVSSPQMGNFYSEAYPNPVKQQDDHYSKTSHSGAPQSPITQLDDHYSKTSHSIVPQNPATQPGYSVLTSPEYDAVISS